MKLINVTMIAAAMLMAVCSQIKAEENMKNVLNEKQQCMAAIACLEAKGDIDGLTMPNIYTLSIKRNVSYHLFNCFIIKILIIIITFAQSIGSSYDD